VLKSASIQLSPLENHPSWKERTTSRLASLEVARSRRSNPYSLFVNLARCFS
jgi:hypothetical protein